MEKTNIAKWITDGRMTKYKLAKELGVSWVTVQNWCQGRYEPSESNQKRLLKIMTKISVSEIV